MRDEMTVVIRRQAANKIRKGYPLIEADSFLGELSGDEGAILKLVDEQKAFIAKAYYGKQNKGLGWVLTANEREAIDVRFFEKKLKQAFALRADLLESEETTAFRLFNGEGDGIGGLTIDYYDGFLVCTLYSKGIHSFRQELYEALSDVIETRGIYEKKRFKGDGEYVPDDDFVSGERGEFPLLVKENGMIFAVYLNDGPMVGVFLDQRDVRLRIRNHYARDKTVLNTFSYTGAFSVAAALGGAAKTTSVDLAKRSVAKTSEQFLMNGIDPESQEMVVMDTFEYFNYANRKGRSFDLVILDPPSFARTKKRTFSAAKDYPKLLEEAIAVTNKGGTIVASTNHSAVSIEKFRTFIAEACKRSGKKYKIIEEYRLPADFRTNRLFANSDYLKVVFFEVN